MTGVTPLLGYELGLGIFAVMVLLWVVAVSDPLEKYDRHVWAVVVGSLVFVLGGPVATVLAPDLVHWLHGTAAVLVGTGLYGPVANGPGTDRWETLLFEDPARSREPAEWMRPMDDEILELLHSSELVLTPAVVAINIDRSREEVNRRLTTLASRGLVERIERGKYRLTRRGAQYLCGDVSSIRD